MAKAGNCSQCGGNQWLNESGGCVAGHGPECISGVYEIDRPPAPPAWPAPAPEPSRPAKKTPIWIIVAVVLLLLAVPGCGVLTAIAIPVFNASKANAQKRACLANMMVVEGATMTYVASNDGAAVPSDWNSAMRALVPTYIKTAPRCPAGGTYEWIPDSSAEAGGYVRCSIHGTRAAPSN